MPQPKLFRSHADAFAEVLGEGALVAEGVGLGDLDDFVSGLDEGFGGGLDADAEHVITDILKPSGSGFIGHHGNEPLFANDNAWVRFSMEIGPDGAAYVLDWHDTEICGNATHDKDTGRIYRLATKGLPGKSGINLAAQTILELVGLLTHRNVW